MKLPRNKTKIVATIGPASRDEKTLERMIKAGMSVARINFAHGSFEEHKKIIERIRRVSERMEEPIAVLGDLPGVKIRVGEIAGGSVTLRRWQTITLTTKDVLGNEAIIPVKFKRFPKLVSRGDLIYLSDGFITLKVERVEDTDVVCKVIVGGTLFSHKGINIPKARLPLEALTKRDFEILDFIAENGVDAVGISFVGSAYDVLRVRRYLEDRKFKAFLVAKIERPDAVRNFNEILRVADGIMIARGDLGVELPIEKLPILQKKLIHRANTEGKPVITATQMLESMTHEKLPTRAEVTDVANAILDGTDALMLSEETAVGKYPLESVKMMAKIAKTTEAYRESRWTTVLQSFDEGRRKATIKEAIARSIIEALKTVNVHYILTPTRTGETSRLIARFKPPQWVLAFTKSEKVARFLTFTYGVYPFTVEKETEETIIELIQGLGLVEEGDVVLLTKGTPVGRTSGTNTVRIFQV